MGSGPSDEARAAAVATRLAEQTARVDSLRAALAAAVKSTEEPDINKTTLKVAEIYRRAGLSKAAFYRYRSQYDDIRSLCDALDPSKDRSQTSEADADGLEGADSAALVVNLMQQVATAKTFINILELERRGHLKDIKSMRAGIKALESRTATIARYADRLRSKLVQHGVEIEVSDLPSPATGKPDLRVVKHDDAGDSSDREG